MSELKMDHVPLFGDLSESQQTAVWDRMVLEKRHIGEHLYRQGEPGDRLYLVKSGWVRLVSDQIGVIASSGPGSILGDGDVLLGHNHGTTAEAITEVEALALGLDELVEIVAEQPEIGLKFSALYKASVVPLIRYLVERRLRPIPGLDELPDNVLVTLAGRLCVHYATTGETLFAAGQAPANLYILDEGRVSAADASGPAGEFGPGDLVAERNVLMGRGHTLTARAAGACRLWELSTADLERLTALYPDLRAALSRVLVSRLDATDQSRAAAALRATPLFQSAPSEALTALAARMVSQTVPAGSDIFEADTPAEAMYLVDGGSVELLDRRGEPQGRIQAGSYFGERGLLGGRPYDLTAVARKDTTLWTLSRADYEGLAQRYPALRRAVSDQLAAEKDAGVEHFAERHLRRLSLFAGMTTEQLREVAGYLRMEEYRPGQMLYQRGQPGEAVYLIEQGRVSVQTRAPEGRVRVLASMGPGEFVGETALLTGEPHATDTFAQTEVTAWALSRQDFETLLTTYPILALNLSRTLSYRLRERNEQAAEAGTNEAVAAQVPVVPALPEPPARPAQAPAKAAPVQAPSAARRPAPQPVAAPVRQPRAARPAPAAWEGPLGWFNALSTGGKIRLVVIAVLVLWVIGGSILLLISSLPNNKNSQSAGGKGGVRNSAVLVAMAAGDEQAAEIAATWTPWPTDTPIPTLAPTSTPVPTATNTPTNTPVPPTETPAPPTATRVPPTATRVPPTAVPQPVAAAPAAVAAVPVAAPVAPKQAAKAAHKYTLKEVYHLSACENGSGHNIFIQVVDASGKPVDGIKIGVRPGDMTDPVFSVLVTGNKGPGKDEFPMYKTGQYAVYPSADGNSPDDAEVAMPLGSVRDQAGNLWPEEQCGDGGGNTLGHNSFRVVFQKNW